MDAKFASHIARGKLSFVMRAFPLLLLILSFGPAAAAAEATGGSTVSAAPRLFLAGDSTMANKPPDLPERGWGQALPWFFRDPTMVDNQAVNGRSTKSFIDEGRWQRLVGGLQPGDFVLIQFGHNDEKVDKPAVGTDAATTFRDNLHRFVREVRAKGASPILATPVCRRKFDPAGKLVDTHGAYPDAVRAVAAEDKVPLLDLQRATEKMLLQYGPEDSKQLFMWIEPGKYPKLPNGSQDDTHFVEIGATKVAELAVGEMRELKLPLTRWLKPID